jgi:hypothetical protein
MNWI